MSSSFYVLCLSHDPAMVAAECRSATDAEERIAAGIDEHPHCDLLISRVSGAPVEFGCPPVTGRDGQHHCMYHPHSAQWADAAWLRVLTIAYGKVDPDLILRRDGRLACWPPDRVHRLRDQLGITD